MLSKPCLPFLRYLSRCRLRNLGSVLNSLAVAYSTAFVLRHFDWAIFLLIVHFNHRLGASQCIRSLPLTLHALTTFTAASVSSACVVNRRQIGDLSFAPRDSLCGPSAALHRAQWYGVCDVENCQSLPHRVYVQVDAHSLLCHCLSGGVNVLRGHFSQEVCSTEDTGSDRVRFTSLLTAE